MSARPQVTITLGRSGQVVKRAGPDANQSDYEPISGGKRPIKERLGNNVDNPHSYGSKNKRQRTENHNWSSSDVDSKDRPVSRDDLRFKLIHKSLSRRSNSVNKEQNGVDLREKLSRNSQIPLRYDSRQPYPEQRTSSLVRRIPPTRSADDLLHMDSLRKPYSSSLHGLRHRSPDRFLGASRRMSPPRSYDDMRHVPSVRSIDPSRPTSFVTKSIVDAPRPAPFMSKATVPVEPAKPILRGPPPGGMLQKASYMSEGPVSVEGLLNSLGLGKYAILFQAEEVDMTALKQMGDNDLKELGIPMGPRKKILLAVLPRSKQRHP